MGAGGLEAFFPPLPTFPHSYNPKGGVYPSLYPSPGPNMGGGKPRRSPLSCIGINFLTLQFYDLFYKPLFIHQPALLEPTCPILVSNLASKTGSKSMLFGVQEPTYVATTENVKIGTTLKRKPCFCLPRPPKNPPKFNKKSILRASYVAVFF